MSDSLIRRGDTVLFQGDSITNAFRMPDEINDAYQMGAGYAMICAGRLRADRPTDGVTCLNRGVSGDALPALGHRWQADCLDLKPDVLSLLIGINDHLQSADGGGGTTAARFAEAYAGLIDQTRAALPGLRLVLLEPFALPAGELTGERVEDVRRRADAVRAVAERVDARFVGIQAALDRAARITGPGYWLYDGIHPTAAGHALIADHWLAAVGHRRPAPADAPADAAP